MAKTYPYVVVGLGLSGMSCCRYLHSKGIEFAVTDSRAAPPCLSVLKKLAPTATVSCGALDEELLLNAQVLLLSPGVDRRTDALLRAQQAGIPLLGDIDLFAQVVNSPVIAITGSNGKSTVTTLLGEMLQAAGKKVAVAGNIGVPVLDVVGQDVDYFVLELSSFQLELTSKLSCCSAVVLNVSPDHLDRYDSYEDYVAAKRRVYQHCAHPVVNLEQPLAWQDSAHGDSVTFALNRRADFYLQRRNKQWFLMFRDSKLLPYQQLASSLRAFPENVLAALALAYQAGSSLSDMIQVVRSFKGLPHRCQVVATRQDVCWVDDSKATNTGSAIAAIERFARNPGQLILLAGGQGKGADFSELGKTIDELVAHVVLMGEDANNIAQHVAAAQVHHAPSMQDAVQVAAKVAQASDTVLLAPACASFDMFASFSERGQQFQGCVAQLDA